MVYRLTIDTSGAAFDGLNKGPEIARILRKEAERLEGITYYTSGVSALMGGHTVGASVLLDGNGNFVGIAREAESEGER